MKMNEIQVGVRIEYGDGQDRDTGTISAVDGQSVTVNWDSLVQTKLSVDDLTDARIIGYRVIAD